MAETKTDQEPSIEEILESIRQIISEDGSSPQQAGAAAPAGKPLDLAPAAPAQAKDKAVPLTLKGEEQPQSKDKAVPLSLDVAGQMADKAVPLTLKGEEQPQGKDVPLELKGPEQPQDKGVPLTLKGQEQTQDKAVALDLAPKAEAADNNDDILDLTEKVAPASAVKSQPEPEPAIEMMDKPLKVDMPMTDEASTLISSQTAAAATDAMSKLLNTNIAVEREDVVGRVGKVTLEDMAREMMMPLIKSWVDQNLPGIVEKVVQKEVEKLSRRVTGQ